MGIVVCFCVFVFCFVLFHINSDSDCLQPNKPTNAQTLVLQVVVSAVALEVVASEVVASEDEF